MKVRFQQSPSETARMNTNELRENFLVRGLIQDDTVQLLYTHYDRMITGGVKPVHTSPELYTDPELRADYFLERREIGIINVGGDGKVSADGEIFSMEKLDCLYVGRGVKKVSFSSDNQASPAIFYLLSAPAHQSYPNRLMKKNDATPVSMGDVKTSNQRMIYKYIYDAGIKSCQLVMGLTVLSEGNVWNTMPAHTHTRRMEAYFYFDLAADQRIFHFMGEPSETRHIIAANYDAVISPPWSIHSGCGTSNYAFIWGMGGENYMYTDMDPYPTATLL